MAKPRKTDKKYPQRRPSTAFKPGHKKVGGRKKGTPNRFTSDLKNALLSALAGRGGAELYFRQHLGKSPRSMLQLIGKLLPTQITGKDGGPIEMLTQKAATGLSNLTTQELETLQALLTKAGLTENEP